MENINIWIRNIIFIIIVSSFVEMIMPDGTYKKYCKLIFGLIIIVIIIKPIVLLSGNDILMDKTNFETSNIITKNNIIDNNKYISDKQKVLVIDTYRKKLETQIAEKVSSLEENYVTEVSIDMDKNTDSSGFGSIRKIYVTLKGKKESLNIEQIERVSLSNEKDVYSDVNDNQISDYTIKKIQDSINLIFGIPKENIVIKLDEIRSD
jgi:stage III sporulation protein AF